MPSLLVVMYAHRPARVPWCQPGQAQENDVATWKPWRNPQRLVQRDEKCAMPEVRDTCKYLASIETRSRHDGYLRFSLNGGATSIQIALSFEICRSRQGLVQAVFFIFSSLGVFGLGRRRTKTSANVRPFMPRPWRGR